MLFICRVRIFIQVGMTQTNYRILMFSFTGSLFVRRIIFHTNFPGKNSCLCGLYFRLFTPTKTLWRIYSDKISIFVQQSQICPNMAQWVLRECREVLAPILYFGFSQIMGETVFQIQIPLQVVDNSKLLKGFNSICEIIL